MQAHAVANGAQERGTSDLRPETLAVPRNEAQICKPLACRYGPIRSADEQGARRSGLWEQSG